MVFNHRADFFAFQDIKNNRENSQYKDWYCNKLSETIHLMTDFPTKIGRL